MAVLKKKRLPAAAYLPGGRFGTNTTRWLGAGAGPARVGVSVRPAVGGVGMPGGTQRTLVSPAWGSDEDYRNALLGQWDYAAAENAMRQGDIADEAAINAAIGRGQADRARFMADLTTALGRSNIGDLSRLAARGAADSGALAAVGQVRQEAFQRESTASAQDLADRIAEWRTGLTNRKADRQARFLDTAGGIMARIAADPRYQPREAVWSDIPAAAQAAPAPVAAPTRAFPGLTRIARQYVPRGRYGTITTRPQIRVRGRR